MASTDATAIPVKNQAYRVVFPILDSDGDLVTGATGLDSEVSKDQGTFTDCTNEATEIATSSGMYYLDLTSTEMNADCVAVIVKTSSSGAKTTPMVFYPQEAGDIKVNVTYWNGTAVSSPATAGIPEVNVKNINNVAASSVTTINANVGTTQPINFTGTGASALAKSDMVDVAGAAVSTSTAQIGVNVVQISGDSTAADNEESFFDGTGYAGTNNVIPTVTTLTNDPSGVTTLLSRIPSGLFTGITSLAQWLGLIAGKQTGNSTARTELRATGAGSGTFDETTDSQEAIRDRGDAAWITATGFSTHTAADVWAVATRLLTAGTNIVLAKGTGVTGFNDLSAAQVNAEADTALVDAGVTTTVTGRIDAAISTRSSHTAAQTAAAVWDYLTSAATTLGSLGKLIVDNLDATISSRLSSAGYTAPLTAAGIRSAVGLASANLDTQLAAIDTQTDLIPASPAATGDAMTLASGSITAAVIATGAIDADALATDAVNEIADGVLDRNMATGTDSGSATVRTVRQALRFLRNKWSISGTTLTVTKEDDSTASWTSTLSTDASADPVTGSDPASS